MTEVTCTTCKKQTTVPFVPTPGRPVYCRDCFTKKQNSPSSGPRRGPRRNRHNMGGGDVPKQKMLSQGRKTHFLYDARKALERDDEGGMDDAHHRAFLEGLFARGARTSTEAAKEFLDEKTEEGIITEDEQKAIGRLLDRYSEWR